MATNQAATMEEIALKLWALRTGQHDPELTAGASEPPQPLRLAPLTIARPQQEGRAAG